MGYERRGGRRPVISDQEIRDQMDKGLNAGQIATYYTNLGRQITSEAIRQRIVKMRDKDQEREGFILPWQIRQEHANGGPIYKMVLAYGKHQKGHGLTPYELEQSRKLEQYLKDRDAVITYNKDEGFIVRNRRPGDGPGALAA